MARADVEEIRCTTLINPVKVPDWPFRWTINPYRGCRHACRYCFARPTHEFLGLGTGRQFEQRVFAKVNAPEVLRSELKRPSWKREPIALGTASDPYEPAEKSYKLTRKVLGVLRDFANPVSITTKGVLVQRDIDVLQELSQVADVQVNFSVGCLDEEVWKATEPGAPNPLHRLEAMQALVEAGIHAGVIAAPIIPGLSDSEESLDELVGAAAAHKAQYLGGNVMFLRPGSKEWFMPLIRESYPHLAPLYANYYRGAYAPKDYARKIMARLDSLRSKWHLDERYSDKTAARRPDEDGAGIMGHVGTIPDFRPTAPAASKLVRSCAATVPMPLQCTGFDTGMPKECNGNCTGCTREWDKHSHLPTHPSVLPFLRSSCHPSVHPAPTPVILSEVEGSPMQFRQSTATISGHEKEAPMDLVDEQLRFSTTIAVVGLSPNPDRDSHRVSAYMQSQGYRIIPVNPTVDEVLGEKSYPDLLSVPGPIDMVDIFRRSELVMPVVEEAIQVGARYIWMQDGVINEEAAQKARDAGIPVVMDD